MSTTTTPATIYQTTVFANSITSSYAKEQVAFVKGSRTLQRFRLDALDLWWTSESGSPTEISWYLTYDSTGDEIALPAKTSTIVAGQTAGTGGVSETVEKWFVLDSDATLYVWAKFNDGTTPSATGAELRATVTEG